MRKERSKDRPWTYLMYEFYGGALPGSGADRPRLPELKSDWLQKFMVPKFRLFFEN